MKSEEMENLTDTDSREVFKGSIDPVMSDSGVSVTSNRTIDVDDGGKYAETFESEPSLVNENKIKEISLITSTENFSLSDDSDRLISPSSASSAQANTAIAQNIAEEDSNTLLTHSTELSREIPGMISDDSLNSVLYNTETECKNRAQEKVTPEESVHLVVTSDLASGADKVEIEVETPVEATIIDQQVQNDIIIDAKKTDLVGPTCEVPVEIQGTITSTRDVTESVPITEDQTSINALEVAALEPEHEGDDSPTSPEIVQVQHLELQQQTFVVEADAIANHESTEVATGRPLPSPTSAHAATPELDIGNRGSVVPTGNPVVGPTDLEEKIELNNEILDAKGTEPTISLGEELHLQSIQERILIPVEFETSDEASLSEENKICNNLPASYESESAVDGCSPVLGSECAQNHGDSQLEIPAGSSPDKTTEKILEIADPVKCEGAGSDVEECQPVSTDFIAPVTNTEVVDVDSYAEVPTEEPREEVPEKENAVRCEEAGSDVEEFQPVSTDLSIPSTDIKNGDVELEVGSSSEKTKEEVLEKEDPVKCEGAGSDVEECQPVSTDFSIPSTDVKNADVELEVESSSDKPTDEVLEKEDPVKCEGAGSDVEECQPVSTDFSIPSTDVKNGDVELEVGSSSEKMTEEVLAKEDPVKCEGAGSDVEECQPVSTDFSITTSVTQLGNIDLPAASSPQLITDGLLQSVVPELKEHPVKCEDAGSNVDECKLMMAGVEEEHVEEEPVAAIPATAILIPDDAVPDTKAAVKKTDTEVDDSIIPDAKLKVQEVDNEIITPELETTRLATETVHSEGKEDHVECEENETEVEESQTSTGTTLPETEIQVLEFEQQIETIVDQTNVTPDVSELKEVLVECGESRIEVEKYQQVSSDIAAPESETVTDVMPDIEVEKSEQGSTNFTVPETEVLVQDAEKIITPIVKQTEVVSEIKVSDVKEDALTCGKADLEVEECLPTLRVTEENVLEVTESDPPVPVIQKTVPEVETEAVPNTVEPLEIRVADLDVASVKPDVVIDRVEAEILSPVGPVTENILQTGVIGEETAESSTVVETGANEADVTVSAPPEEDASDIDNLGLEGATVCHIILSKSEEELQDLESSVLTTDTPAPVETDDSSTFPTDDTTSDSRHVSIAALVTESSSLISETETITGESLHQNVEKLPASHDNDSVVKTLMLDRQRTVSSSSSSNTEEEPQQLSTRLYVEPSDSSANELDVPTPVTEDTNESTDQFAPRNDPSRLSVNEKVVLHERSIMQHSSTVKRFDHSIKDNNEETVSDEEEVPETTNTFADVVNNTVAVAEGVDEVPGVAKDVVDLAGAGKELIVPEPIVKIEVPIQVSLLEEIEREVQILVEDKTEEVNTAKDVAETLETETQVEEIAAEMLAEIPKPGEIDSPVEIPSTNFATTTEVEGVDIGEFVTEDELATDGTDASKNVTSCSSSSSGRSDTVKETHDKKMVFNEETGDWTAEVLSQLKITENNKEQEPLLQSVGELTPEKPTRESWSDVKTVPVPQVVTHNRTQQKKVLKEEMPSADPPRKKRNKFCQCC